MSNFFLRNKSYQFTINVDGLPEDFNYNVFSSKPEYITITQNPTNVNIFQFDISNFPEAANGTSVVLTFIVSMAGVSDIETIDKVLLSHQESSLLQGPSIFGPPKKTYGTTLSLMADTVSLFEELGVDIETYRWVFPDESIHDSKIINYEIPDDINLIGTTLNFKCKAIDSLDNESNWILFDVLIDDDDNPAIVDTTWS